MFYEETLNELSSKSLHFMEIREGKWVNVPLGGCRWIVMA